MQAIPILALCLLLTACNVGITSGEKLEPVLSITNILSYAPENTTTPEPAASLEPAASPEPTAPPATPAPTAVPRVVVQASSPTSSGPIIQYFHANVGQAAPGDAITLSWASTGATEAVLEYRSLQDSTPAYSWKVDTTVSFSCQIRPDERDDVEFTLHVRDTAGHSARANLRFDVQICPNPWFFSPVPWGCGEPPIVSQAAEQHFERGTMIWVQEKWIEGAFGQGYVFILYDDGRSPRWDVVQDQWSEGQPDRDPELSPPTGLQQPIRGFGLAWRQDPDVRQRLGWAVDQEQGFNTTLQHDQHEYGSVYLRALDGNVWRLGLGYNSWDKIAAENQE